MELNRPQVNEDTGLHFAIDGRLMSVRRQIGTLVTGFYPESLSVAVYVYLPNRQPTAVIVALLPTIRTADEQMTMGQLRKEIGAMIALIYPEAVRVVIYARLPDEQEAAMVVKTSESPSLA